MSTNPDINPRAEDRAVTVISLWLARHLGDDELLSELEAIGAEGLAPEQAEAVTELLDQLRTPDGRGELEMVARETLESLAHGA
jgi:hypothetical protein